MNIIKWTGVSLGALVTLLFSAFVLVYIITDLRINKSYEVETQAITIPTDIASLTEGKRLFITRGCSDCHGNNLAGKIFIDDQSIGTLAGSNLTMGAGGIGSRYQDLDFIRAIRNGIAPNKKPLRYMPSQEYYAMNDTQLGAIIAYIRSAPPVANQPAIQLGPLLRYWFLIGKAPLLSAEIIDHYAMRPQVIQKEATAKYGQYLANTCSGCHGKDLAGGPVPGAPTDLPKASNITNQPNTGIGLWTEADFFRAMRKGIRPNGSQIDTFMPWNNFSQMTDLEIKALWLYLQTLPTALSSSR